MDVRDFDFHLPPELIAQEPPAERTGARLLHLDRGTGAIAHSTVLNLPNLLAPGDLVIVNNTRVFPARLLGHRVPSGGAVECLLIRRMPDAERSSHDATPDVQPVTGAADRRMPSVGRPTSAQRSTQRSTATAQRWEALMHPGQKLKPGSRVVFEGTPTIHGEVLERRFYGRREIRLWTVDGSSVDAAVDAIGHVPLPPYIRRADRLSDRERYQTVFAHERGSVAAPTAGLHFNDALAVALRSRGIGIAEITLHVGYGTFQPVRVEQVEAHHVEAEWYSISERAAGAINTALDSGRRIIAVGTTTTRGLESAAQRHGGRVEAGYAETDLFIYPGFEFRVLRGLMTNFHLPRSSLLMLVAAFAGREHVLEAYRAAIAEGYRFYSYGDAMLIL